MIDPELRAAIKKCIVPDPWQSKWSVANDFGHGWAVEVEVGELLHSLVRTLKPTVLVETGTHKGFSALMIATALKENGSGHLHTVDMVDHGVKALLDRFGASAWVTLLKMHSVDALKAMPRDRKIDFLWLDADHQEASVLAELDAAFPLLKSGSYVGFHDALVDPGEERAVRAIRKKHPSWEYIRLMSARGVDLMRVQ